MKTTLSINILIAIGTWCAPEANDASATSPFLIHSLCLVLCSLLQLLLQCVQCTY